MKVIYTYIDPNDENYIKPETLVYGLWSILQTSKFYSDIVLYTSEPLLNKFKQIEVLKIDYRLLEVPRPFSTGYLPKLYTHLQQEEEYIHLDLDLILFQPLIDKKNSPVVFTHREIDLNWGLSLVNAYRECYFDPAEYYNKKYGLGYNQNLVFDTIPNVGIAHVKDIPLFKSCVEDALYEYHSEQFFFEQLDSRFCYLEQALIHKYLLERSESYFKSIQSSDYLAFHNSIVVDSLKGIDINNLPAIHFKGISKNLTRNNVVAIDAVISMIGKSKFLDILNVFNIKNFYPFKVYQRYSTGMG